MNWTEEAERAIGRVPFFVRKKVKGYVEQEAAGQGAHRVTMEHVNACRKRFLSGKGMEKEVKGFQVETCFGPGGCENRAAQSDLLMVEVEKLLLARDFPGFLRSRVGGPLKFHHEFRVSISECPNACSRPQIVDIGLIGALLPEISDEPCTGCGACADACREGAVEVDFEADAGPVLDPSRCVGCGKCVRLCPSGTLRPGAGGWRVLLGGKLGRHPQLGRELAGIHSTEKVIEIVNRCLDIYFEQSAPGERFGAVLNRVGHDAVEPLASLRE
ncbi:MAG: 4Fe-4S binding protein [Syntrophobacteraceae bacterium]